MAKADAGMDFFKRWKCKCLKVWEKTWAGFGIGRMGKGNDAWWVWGCVLKCSNGLKLSLDTAYRRCSKSNGWSVLTCHRIGTLWHFFEFFCLRLFHRRRCYPWKFQSESLRICSRKIGNYSGYKVIQIDSLWLFFGWYIIFFQVWLLSSGIEP